MKFLRFVLISSSFRINLKPMLLYQAVVHYMGEFVAKRDLKTQSVKTAKTWAPCCFSSRPTRKKHDILDHLKA